MIATQVKETPPNNAQIGKIWIKPSIGQAYIKLSDWIPFAGSDRYITYTIPLTILKRGEDITSYVRIDSMVKEDSIYEKTDQLHFVIDDKDGNIDISEGEEVIVFKKQDEESIPEIWFAGNIEEVKPVEYYSGAKKFLYNITCSDYGRRLNKELVVEVYENMSASSIIADIIENYGTEFFYEEVTGTPNIEKIKFNYKSINECIKQIADIVNYYWYVDYERCFHFFPVMTYYAPYKLTDDISTTGNYTELTISRNKDQLRNRVYVRGGTYLSSLFTEEFVADGIQRTWKLAYKPRNPINVYVDTGSGYEEKTLGIDGISETSEFLVNHTNQLIKNGTHATLNSGDKIKITYKYEIQVLTQDDNVESQEYMRRIEGGSGVYAYLITDTNILSVDTAHTRAQAELLINSFPVIEGSFKTDQDGYRSGQTLLIDMLSWGYAEEEVVIQKVISRLKTDNKFLYEVNFATRKKTLTEFLGSLHENILMIPQAYANLEEETLHDLINIETENIQFKSENTPSFEERNPSEVPFKWNDGSGTYSEDFFWNEAQWWDA